MTKKNMSDFDISEDSDYEEDREWNELLGVANKTKLIDRSEGLYNDSVMAKANKAIQQIKECQLFGNKGHLAKQSKVLSKELCDCV